MNWVPDRNIPFLIARTDDPFDKNVDADGNLVPTAQDPYALGFDPTYVYASNQGIRFYVGLDLSIN